jgi:hypothetical protein
MEHGRCLCDKGYFPQSDEAWHPKIPGKYNRYFENGNRGETFPACIPEAEYGEIANDYLLGRLRSLGQTPDEIRKNYLTTTDHVLATTAPGEKYPYRDDPDFIGYDFPENNPWRTKHGFLWWHSQVMWWLLKSAPMRPTYEKFEKDIGLDTRSCIGVHIRHGDSCNDPAQPFKRCKPLSAYINAIKKLNKRYGKRRHIYLATDDHTVVEEAKKAVAAGDLTLAKDGLLSQNMDRQKYASGDSVDERSALNKPSTGLELMTDVWAMTSCDFFVGTMTSSIGWLVLDIITARKGHTPPFISVDCPWGYDFNAGRISKGNGGMPRDTSFMPCFKDGKQDKNCKCYDESRVEHPEL